MSSLGVKPRSQETPALSRKDSIANAVIIILGEQGSRALSHRSVDKQLGLPEGSTSFYFRRRADLLEAGFNKLIDLDLASMNKHFIPILRNLNSGKPIQIEDVADCHYAFWQELTLASNRYRTIARFEFFLYGARDPAVNRFYEKKLESLFRFGTVLFAALGSRCPNWASLQYSNIFRGDTMAHFLVPSAVRGLKVTPEYFKIRFDQIIVSSNLLEKDLPGPVMEADCA